MKVNCLNCNTEINSETGRRPKKFCSNKCRVAYWQTRQKTKITPELILEMAISSVLEKFYYNIRHEFVERLQEIRYGGKEVPIRKGNNPLAIYGQNKPNTDRQVENKVTSGKTEETEPMASQIEINDKISALLNEKCPKERDTALGRKIWAKEQNDKMDALKEQLKNLK